MTDLIEGIVFFHLQFPYGANSTAQGFTFPFVPVQMPSAQPTERLMSDLEERLIAQVKEMHVSFQESLLPLISKTVSDAIATQVVCNLFFTFIFPL
jgi:hypothetical protein